MATTAAQRGSAEGGAAVAPCEIALRLAPLGMQASRAGRDVSAALKKYAGQPVRVSWPSSAADWEQTGAQFEQELQLAKDERDRLAEAMIKQQIRADQRAEDRVAGWREMLNAEEGKTAQLKQELQEAENRIAALERAKSKQLKPAVHEEVQGPAPAAVAATARSSSSSSSLTAAAASAAAAAAVAVPVGTLSLAAKALELACGDAASRRQLLRGRPRPLQSSSAWK